MERRTAIGRAFEAPHVPNRELPSESASRGPVPERSLAAAASPERDRLRRGARRFAIGMGEQKGVRRLLSRPAGNFLSLKRKTPMAGVESVRSGFPGTVSARADAVSRRLDHARDGDGSAVTGRPGHSEVVPARPWTSGRVCLARLRLVARWFRMCCGSVAFSPPQLARPARPPERTTRFAWREKDRDLVGRPLAGTTRRRPPRRCGDPAVGARPAGGSRENLS